MDNQDHQDLISQLAAATIAPEVSPIDNTNTMDSMPGSIPNMPVDFKQDFDEIPDNVLNDQQEDLEGSNIGEIAANSAISKKQLAKSIIDTTDALCQQLLPGIYISTLSDKEKAALKSIGGTISKGIDNKENIILSKEDQKYASVVNEYNDYVASIPLSKDEKSNILPALSSVLEKVNFNPSPESALITVVGITFFPRVLPLLLNKIK